MDMYTIILAILLCLAFVLIVQRIFAKGGDSKPTGVKKNEIIEAYEEQMKVLVERYANDKELLNSQKKIFLKSVSSELHRNIFFDEEEVKAVIQHLASL